MPMARALIHHVLFYFEKLSLENLEGPPIIVTFLSSVQQRVKDFSVIIKLLD